MKSIQETFSALILLNAFESEDMPELSPELLHRVQSSDRKHLSMQIPPAKNIFAKGVFCTFDKTATYRDFFAVVKNKFVAVHILDVFKIYDDSSVTHKEIISVIKQLYKFGKRTAYRILHSFTRTVPLGDGISIYLSSTEIFCEISSSNILSSSSV